MMPGTNGGGYPGGMSPRGLSARQRKQVYMHSSIFDPQGPSTRSVYAPQRQQVIYNQLAPELPKNDYDGAEFQSRLDLPPPADMRQTQNHGHDVVFSNPRNDEAIELVHARADDAIPPEFWRTDVNLHWADHRNELNRPRQAFGGIYDKELSAKDWKAREMSSELFSHARMTYNSTDKPKADLQSASKHFLQCDSRVVEHPLPDDERASAHDRFYANLDDSSANTFPHLEANAPPQALVGPEGRHPATNPQGHESTRRRTEKNYSDLFNTQMGDRNAIRQREEATATQRCSWLDTRSEIASRNIHPHQEAMRASAKKQEQLSSHMLGAWGPIAKLPETADEKQVTKAERVCWDTNSLLTQASEIARRAQHKDFHPSQDTAHSRKLEQLSSSVFGDKYSARGGGGPPTSHGWEKVYRDENNRTYLAVRGPEPGLSGGPPSGRISPQDPQDPTGGYRPPTAREQKLASLAGSSIFGDE